MIGRWTGVWLLASVTLATGLTATALASDIKIIVNDHAITTLDIQAGPSCCSSPTTWHRDRRSRRRRTNSSTRPLRIDDAKKRRLDIPDRAAR